MLKKVALMLSCTLMSLVCHCQTDHVIIQKNIRIKGDSAIKKQLISSINGFLKEIAKPNKENAFIPKENLPETAALLNEIRGMESGNDANKKSVYKCYLTNVILLEDNIHYIVQLSYMGVDESTPVLKASFKLMAKREGNLFYFYSPLKRNTATWKSKKMADFVFHYRSSLNATVVSNYVKKANEFDKKLNTPPYTNEIYYCDDLQEALELLGIDYKSDYNGSDHGDLSSFENDIELDIVGSSDLFPWTFDLHDLWHDRLHHTVSTEIINKPVDEACAYLYGGSWLISWDEIFRRFKTSMGTERDWLTAFNENKNFAASQQYHLYVSYVINALIVQKIEKEKGFPSVIELLSCEKKEISNENYFKALNKIIGINRLNFNEQVEKLIENKSSKIN